MSVADFTDFKRAERELWATGDYGAIARAMFADVGRRVVERIGVRPGERVLDVACGTGNAAIRAAQAGGRVVGLDLTPELLREASREAVAAGVEAEWIEGDAEDLPFQNEGFDVVLSTFGCMFAPRHEVAARELVRVLAPGGRLAICSWTPRSSIADLMRALFAHVPPAAGSADPPPLWGSEDHVRDLFAATGVELDFELQRVEFRFPSTEAAVRLYETSWGPFVQARELLEAKSRYGALRAELVEVLERHNAATDGTLAYGGEYLLVVGRRR